MTPEWKLKLPQGISGPAPDAFLKLLERWDTIGVEKVLVWHLQSVVAEALPHLAEGLGVQVVSFVGGPPRDFLRTAIAFLRNIGPEEFMLQALEAMGYARVNVTLRERVVHLLDGTWALSGEPYRLGSDDHWAIFWLSVSVPAGLANSALRELWDVVGLMRPKRSHPVLIVNTTSGPLVFRSRSEIPA